MALRQLDNCSVSKSRRVLPTSAVMSTSPNSLVHPSCNTVLMIYSRSISIQHLLEYKCGKSSILDFVVIVHSSYYFSDIMWMSLMPIAKRLAIISFDAQLLLVASSKLVCFFTRKLINVTSDRPARRVRDYVARILDFTRVLASKFL